MENRDPRAKVLELLNSFSTAMFVTTGAGRPPEARPMQMAKVTDDASIWFFTSMGGTLAAEIRQDAVVLLAFQRENSAWLSVRGNARVVKDSARIQQLWKEPYRVWFPGGPADPEITLIEVKPVDAEYWDQRGSNKLEYMFEAAKAYLHGERPNVSDPDQHGKASL